MDVREKTASEKRLIDANAFLEDILTVGIGKTIVEYSESDIGYMIRKRPTVDAVEVVHGRWKEMHYEGGILDGTNFERCSICGYERVFDDPALKTVFKYCPNCGAKMDGGAE